jgi:hypothetical protein
MDGQGEVETMVAALVHGDCLWIDRAVLIGDLDGIDLSPARPLGRAR